MPFIEGPRGFQPLDWDKPILRYRRNLPHWIQAGATYFVTFRLGDSLPADRRAELARTSSRVSRNPTGNGEGTDESLDTLGRIIQIDDLLDAGEGSCVLADPHCARVVLNALHFHDNSRCLLWSYCIMPNHVHILFCPLAHETPSSLLHSWKGYTASQINKHLGRSGLLWEKESYDVMIRDTRHLWKVLQYIGRNQAKAGIPRERWVRYVDPLWIQQGWGFGDEEC